MAEKLYGAHGDIALWRHNSRKSYGERVLRRVDIDAPQNTSREAHFQHAGDIVIHEPLGPAFFQSLSLNWGYALANGAFIWALASSVGAAYFDPHRAIDSVTNAVVTKYTSIGDASGRLGTLITLKDPTERWKFTTGQTLMLKYYQDLKLAYESDPKGLLAAVDEYIEEVAKQNEELQKQGALTPGKQMDYDNLSKYRQVLATCADPDPERNAAPLSFDQCLMGLGMERSDIDKINSFPEVKTQ